MTLEHIRRKNNNDIPVCISSNPKAFTKNNTTKLPYALEHEEKQWIMTYILECERKKKNENRITKTNHLNQLC